MYWLLGIAAAIVLLSWLSSHPKPTFQMALAALEKPLTVLPAPEGGWLNRKDYIRLSNNRINIFYRRAVRDDRKLIEIIDFTIQGTTGGMWITFVEGTIVSMTRCGVTIHNPEVDPRDLEDALRILTIISTAVASQN